jgi:hypothetical protein
MSDYNRRPLRPRVAKRKSEDVLNKDEAKKPKTDDSLVIGNLNDDDEGVAAPVTLSYRWIDEGASLSNGQIDHTLLETIVDGKITMIARGDTILLQSGEKKGSDPDDSFVAKVERMWQAPPKKNTRREDRMRIRVRWYFKVR